jgi:hypothetical protein
MLTIVCNTTRMSSQRRMMTDHALEKSWWLADPPAAKKLPPSSLMSFTKYGQQHPVKVGEYEHLEEDIPQQCIIQIGANKLHLHAKWLPLMMLIQLIQAAALRAALLSSGVQLKKKSTNMLRLMWFYDFLLQQFAQDAISTSKTSAGGCLPDDWIPEAMHRCLTRLELKIPHSPAGLEQESQKLNDAYLNHGDHFSFGVWCSFYICYGYRLLISIQTIKALLRTTKLN